MKIIFTTILILISLTLAGFSSAFSTFTATSYCLKSKMSCGEYPRRGIVAADPKVLKHGTIVEISGAGWYSGKYKVCDTGVKGRRIDIWMPNRKSALHFGRRYVKLKIV